MLGTGGLSWGKKKQNKKHQLTEERSTTLNETLKGFYS